MDDLCLHSAIEKSMQQARRAVPFDSAALWRREGDNLRLDWWWETGALCPAEGAPFRPTDALADAVAADAPLHFQDGTVALEALSGCTDVVLMPVQLANESWGVWGIGWRQRAFDERDVAYLQAVADQLAIIVWSAEAYGQLQDRLIAANAARIEFVSSVSHELRTPMTAIKGYTDMLISGMAGPLSEPQTRFLKVIKANADRLGRLVGDLLEVSRLDAGRIRLQTQAVMLADVVVEAASALQSQIVQNQLTFSTHLPATLPPVQGDPVRLVQVISHLLGNAVRYTPAGGHVSIRATLQPDATGEWVRIDVADSGIGISVQDQPQIFQRFFRADHPLVRDQVGSGLGLSIVKGLVELHGGRVWFESEPGKGTTFSLMLPLAAAA